jgi:hypothetical protein
MSIYLYNRHHIHDKRKFSIELQNIIQFNYWHESVKFNINDIKVFGYGSVLWYVSHQFVSRPAEPTNKNNKK